MSSPCVDIGVAPLIHSKIPAGASWELPLLGLVADSLDGGGQQSCSGIALLRLRSLWPRPHPLLLRLLLCAPYSLSSSTSSSRLSKLGEEVKASSEDGLEGGGQRGGLLVFLLLPQTRSANDEPQLFSPLDYNVQSEELTRS
eukprot:scaffold2981_cov154-Ochromonas_danica.AAC.6